MWMVDTFLYSQTSINRHLITVVTYNNTASIAAWSRTPTVHIQYIALLIKRSPQYYVLQPPSHTPKCSFPYGIKLGNRVIQSQECPWTFNSASFGQLDYTSANIVVLNVAAYYFHTHSHMKDAKGTPGKSPLWTTIGRCSPLGMSSPLCIQCILWKSDSSQ